MTDFTSNDIIVTLQAGTTASTVNVVMPIADDNVHEVPEEGFLALLMLEQAEFPLLVDTEELNLTLGRISDNDGTFSATKFAFNATTLYLNRMCC